MGSRPGTMGPTASQSLRKSCASTTKALTSLMSSRLKPTCTNSSSANLSDSEVTESPAAPTKTAHAAPCPGLRRAQAESVPAARTWSLVRLSETWVASTRSFFQP